MLEYWSFGVLGKRRISGPPRTYAVLVPSLSRCNAGGRGVMSAWGLGVGGDDEGGQIPLCGCRAPGRSEPSRPCLSC